MRSNIDLTKNETFSRNSIRAYESIRDSLNRRLNGGFPWVKNQFRGVKSDEELKEQKTRMILTGNKEERRMTRQYFASMDGNHCDCCGKPLDKFPWKKTNLLLCEQCNEELEEEVNGRIPWKKANRRNTNTHILR